MTSSRKRSRGFSVAGKSPQRRAVEELFLAMGYAQPNRIIDLVQKVIWDELREEFIAALSVDNGQDRRRKDFNQAIFDPETGHSVFTRTTLDMVVDKYDHAVRAMRGQ